MEQLDMLKKFKELLDEGLITQEEYDAKKSELLGQFKAEEPEEIVIDVTSEPEAGPEPVSGPAPEAGPAPDSIGSLFADAQPAAAAPAAAPAKGRFPKAAIIGVAVVAVLLIAFLAFGRGGAGTSEIQGSWNLVAITTNGSSSYNYSNQDYGSLEINGNNWEMNIMTSNFKGTFKLDTKDDSTGTTFYLYDFEFESGGTVKAAYSPANDLLTVCTTPQLDPNNSATFKRK